MAEKRMPERLVSDNSNKARAESVPVENEKRALVKGVMGKPTLSSRLINIFFEGTVKDAIDYMINDIAIPQVKNALIKGLEVMFYGGANSSSSRTDSRGNVPYNSYYVGRDGVRRDNRPVSKGRGTPEDIEKLKRKFDPKLIVIEDRGEAEMVLQQLKRDLELYEEVSVQSLFDMVGIAADWTSTGYGWKKGSLDNARVRPHPDGWRFDLPEPVPIN